MRNGKSLVFADFRPFCMHFLFCYFWWRFRNSVGVMPCISLNTRVKWLCEENPKRTPMSERERSVSSSRSASWIFFRRINSERSMPVCFLNSVVSPPRLFPQYAAMSVQKYGCGCIASRSAPDGNSLRDTAAASAPDRRSPESCDTADFWYGQYRQMTRLIMPWCFRKNAIKQKHYGKLKHSFYATASLRKKSVLRHSRTDFSFWNCGTS